LTIAAAEALVGHKHCSKHLLAGPGKGHNRPKKVAKKEPASTALRKTVTGCGSILITITGEFVARPIRSGRMSPLAQVYSVGEHELNDSLDGISDSESASGAIALRTTHDGSPRQLTAYPERSGGSEQRELRDVGGLRDGFEQLGALRPVGELLARELHCSATPARAARSARSSPLSQWRGKPRSRPMCRSYFFESFCVPPYEQPISAYSSVESSKEGQRCPQQNPSRSTPSLRGSVANRCLFV
jgi:hypothetical protein